MKYLIVAKPGTTPIPVEQGAELLQMGLGWIKAKLADGSLDSTYNVIGGGGIAIGNADTPEQILADLLDYPLYPFFSWEVTPLLDLESSLDKYMEFYKRLASM
jgi:hypothetical protein